jgi:predicted glycogen debranching enzyme
MGFIKFDKDQLINLEYSLKKEMLRSNRAGSFSCTTIIGCNTRKYHGLLICPQPLLDNEKHVLLSKLDETIIQREAEFNIGISKFPGTYNPKGHKYVRNFTAESIPMVTYRVGGVVLTKETLFVAEQERVMIRYTLVEAQSPTILRIKPFLAFRNIHQLSKKNIYLDTKYEKVRNGIKTRMYEGYSQLHMQLSKTQFEYVHAPDWYNDIEYYHEMARGYDYLEDLYVPGFFEFPIKKGESVIFVAGTSEVIAGQITRQFNAELKNRTPRNSFENSLLNSAEQFFSKHDKGVDIIAGYPWYDRIGRYTFLSMPGLFQARINGHSCEPVLKTMISQMDGPNFPETGRGEGTSYVSADTALWFIWALSQCTGEKMKADYIWDEYGEILTRILESYHHGNDYITLAENQLLYIDKKYPAITWMNANVEGQAVTPRYGYVVEVNALWYNAIKFVLEIAGKAKNKSFIKKWTAIADQIPASFKDVFWNEEICCLADYMADGKQDLSVRPNQIIAASVPYSPITDGAIQKILDVVINQLVTPKGLRTLSPQDPFYKGRYFGDTYQRDRALHQGTVWPWLLGHFAEAYLKIYKDKGVEYINSLYQNFENDMMEDGIGTISEFYEGDPPHQSKGAISFAASVAELLRIRELIQKYSVS